MSYLCDTPQNPKSDLTLVFAHGAGAPMDSDFMQALAGLVAERGVRVIRFEFPYMAQRRDDGSPVPPGSRSGTSPGARVARNHRRR